jgi:long-chain acyl-CoA synthetase
MSEATSLPALVLDNAASRGSVPGMREKFHGIWQTYSWADYNEQVMQFALGLQSLGFKAGDKLAVIGDNRPRLYWAQLSAQALGGAAVPVYQDSIADELAYVLADAGVSVIIAEDQEQVDKALSIRDRLPSLTAVIYDNTRGMASYDDPILKSYESVQKLGESGDAKAYEAAVRAMSADTIALMCYTSGTTGKPKGVMLSHGNLLAAGRAFVANEDIQESDDFLSYLPMAWVGDVTYSTAASLLTGASCNCPESPETLQRDLRELGPTGMIAPPRAWEAVLSDIQIKTGDSSGIKKWVFETFMGASLEARRKEETGEALSFGDKFKTWLGEFLVYAPVRDQAGFRRARWCYTGGAPLGPDTFRFFRALGVNLKQVYGSTELSGLGSLQRDDAANPNTVGTACDGIQVRVADSGEVQIKSDGVFVGYYNNPEATKEAFSEDGWFKTGDAGVIDSDGQLTIIDRAKDVGKLQDGSAFAPQFVENKLKYSAYISEAISFGHERPFVCSMVAIDFNSVGKWAERMAMPYTNYMDLSQKPEVRDLIGQEIDSINRTLPEALRIKRYLLLGKDFDADDSEITRTRKLRRSYIAERYSSVIDAFYDGQEVVDLRAEVTFEDGRKSHVDMRLSIQDAAA